ncbi:methylmalonyl-CoA epimerase [Chryseolinea sp. T2]|uniref:methylmalonyl-CoA epimerase n=1 Tax=Chryseolinea sp. T2 TaxID=3129255 RepID=UPI003077A83F
MEKLEHIGIAVRNLEEANKVFARLLGREPYKTEEVESEGVRTSFFDVSGIKIELLESTREGSAIEKFIEKRGEGIHHLAFAVSDVRESLQEHQKAGFQPINPEPKRGADNKLISFLHPRQTGGVLIELCQDIVSP